MLDVWQAVRILISCHILRHLIDTICSGPSVPILRVIIVYLSPILIIIIPTLFFSQLLQQAGVILGSFQDFVIVGVNNVMPVCLSQFLKLQLLE